MKQFFRSSAIACMSLLSIFCVACSQSENSASQQVSADAKVHEEYGAIDHDIVVSAHDVYVYQRSNQSASLGHGFPICLSVEARCAAANVIITTEFDEDAASYVQSEPEARVEGNQIIWEFDYMKQGDCRDMTVWLNAKDRGDIVACTSLQVIPIGCICVYCGCPELEIQKCGPDKSLLGDQVCYEITVTNVGDQSALDVCIRDEVPEGLRHCTGRDSIAYNIGSLCPGESRTVPLSFEARKVGDWCNRATAESCNCPPVSAEACTKIVCHGLDVKKTGPKKQFVGKTASYEISVTNTGNDIATGVCVTDTAPQGTCIKSAPGANICGNNANWHVGDLQPGETKQFSIQLCGNCFGCLCNGVQVTSSEGCCDQDSACTEWVGHSALLIEVTDCEDPLLVGYSTKWQIRVTNQGTASDHNVQLVAKFPDGLRPSYAEGSSNAHIDGQVVIFDVLDELGSKECAEWSVCAEAISEGDQRVKVEMTSALLKIPVVEEESTHVY